MPPDPGHRRFAILFSSLARLTTTGVANVQKLRFDGLFNEHHERSQSYGRDS
jgi:hypothetical protein